MKINFLRATARVPYEELDRGVLGVVRCLNAFGLPTLASCDGHGKEFAWVTLEWCHVPRLQCALHELGISGFTIARRWDFIAAGKANCYVKVEFWNSPVIGRGYS